MAGPHSRAMRFCYNGSPKRGFAGDGRVVLRDRRAAGAKADVSRLLEAAGSPFDASTVAAVA
jgi:hypothetical protein